MEVWEEEWPFGWWGSCGRDMADMKAPKGADWPAAVFIYKSVGFCDTLTAV